MENKKARLTRLEGKRQKNVVVCYEDEDNQPGRLYYDDLLTRPVDPGQVEEWSKAKGLTLVVISYSTEYART